MTKLLVMGAKERGDTLIEVTIALSILAAVISSGYVMANRAYNIGQAARERTQVIYQAQAQIEQLKHFRDTHTWNYFLDDPTYGLKHVMIPSDTTCPAGMPNGCFHMVQFGSEYLPVKGPQLAVASTGSLAFTGDTSVPKVVDLQVKFDFALRGGGNANNSISIKLVNLEGLLQ